MVAVNLRNNRIAMMVHYFHMVSLTDSFVYLVEIGLSTVVSVCMKNVVKPTVITYVSTKQTSKQKI